MTIEAEIKQSKFESEYHKLLVNLIYTTNWLALMHTKYCKRFGISSEQYNILRILRGQGSKPATINLLIDRMLNKASNASRLVEKLRLKGLIKRETSSIDRRSCEVIITAKGLQLLQRMDASERDWIQLLTHLTEEEAIETNNALDKMRKGQSHL